MNFTIDRFEGEVAVIELENKKMINISKEILPINAKEGDIISVNIDDKSTAQRKESISKLIKDVWN